MQVWSLEIPVGTFAIDIASLCVLLIFGTILRRYIPLFQRYLLPNNIIGGFIGLFLVHILVEMYPTPYFMGVSDRMGAYVYHLLALTMIAVGLTQKRTSVGREPILMGMTFVMIYLVQALIGMGVTFALIYTIMPDLFAGFGMLMPLGFGMGPGISYSIANNWEQFGFVDGGVTGLSIAVAGLLAVYIPGIILVRKHIAAGKASNLKDNSSVTDEIKRGILKKENRPAAGYLTTATEAIDSSSFHMAIIGLTYALTYLAARGIELLLISAGAENEVSTLWSFHFIIGTVLALIVRFIIDRAGIGHLIDEGSMTRSANLFVDFMITTSIVAISFSVVYNYLIPIILCSILVPVTTYIIVKKVSYSFFKTHTYEYFVAIAADVIGTIQSSLILLRILDPKFKTTISIEIVYASGVALIAGFPLLVLINAPINFFKDDIITGFWYVTVAMLMYLVMILLAIRFYMKNGDSRGESSSD